MEFELPKINVSFEYDKEKDEMVFAINGVEKRVKTEDMITEMEKLQEQNTALEQEPCDCISRKSILNRFENMNEVYTFASIGDLRKVIESMPSVYPKPIECEDCISRQAMHIELEKWITYGEYKYSNATKYLYDRIDRLPPVTPKPKTGHWIIKEGREQGYDIAGIKTWYIQIMCDKCGFIKTAIEGHTGQYHFCPNCGAKMTESEEV